MSLVAHVRNVLLKEITFALPNAATTAYSADIDLGSTRLPEGIEFEIEVPDASTSEAPDTRTLTVDLVAGAAASPTTQASRAVVFTGAGGVGFTGAANRFQVPLNAGRYLRARSVGGTSFGNMSAKLGTLRIYG